MATILEAHQARWAAAEGIIAVMALGPALVGVATLALIAVLAARRRQATMALARSRGASGRQVVVPAIVEGLLIAVPGAILAAAIAIALVPEAVLSPTIVAAAAVVAIAVTVVTGTVASIVRSRGPGRREDDRTVGRVGTRRVVVEGLVVALAIGGAYLLRERGLHAVSSAGAVGGFDPLIAAVPVLVGVAAGIVVVRLYPIALRGVAAVARRGRGLVLMLAARRATEGGASSAVLLVLLATATVAAFAAVSLDSLDRGADVAAWQSVGGSYRLQAPNGPIPRDLDAAALPGVTTAAGVFEGSAPVGRSSGPQSLFAIADSGPMATALAGTPADPQFPDGFTTPGAGPIPVIISTELAAAPRGVKLGEEFRASVEGYNLTYRVVEVRDGFAGLPRGRPWVLAPREWFVAQAPEARLVPTWTIVDAPATSARRDTRRGDRDVAVGRDHQPGRGGDGAAHGARDPGRPGAHPGRRLGDRGLRGARRGRGARAVGHRPHGGGRQAPDPRADRSPGRRAGGGRARPDHDHGLRARRPPRGRPVRPAAVCARPRPASSARRWTSRSSSSPGRSCSSSSA